MTVIDSIRSLVPPYHAYIDVSLAWKLTSDDEFDNRSVYPLLQDLEIHYQQRIFPPVVVAERSCETKAFYLETCL